MTKLVFGLTTVHHNRPDETKSREETPGTVYPVRDEDFDWLRSRGAVREPTDQELLAYRFATGELALTTAAAAGEGASQDPAPEPESSPPAKKGAGKTAADGEDQIG